MLKWIMDTTKSISGTSSIISFAADYEIAFISANCGNLSGEEIKERNYELSASLLHRGYGITQINNNCIEDFGRIVSLELKEKTYFVVNLKHATDFYQTLFKISEYYNQDSFLYMPEESSTAYVIGTSYTGWPGYGVKLPVGKLQICVDKKYLLKKQSTKDLVDVLNLDTFKSHTLYGKLAIAVICKPLDDALRK